MIIFVAIGHTPRYTRDALTQARQSNPGERIALLHEGAAAGWRRFAAAAKVDLFDIRYLRDDVRLAEFRRRSEPRLRFRSGFWQHTTSRFFVLRAFMERGRIDVATHLENDVLLYAPLIDLALWPPFCEPVLSTVFESPERAIPNVVRIGARRCLDAFADFVLAQSETGVSDDMARVAAFRRARPEWVADLPTLPPKHAHRSEWTDSLFAADVAPIPLPPGGWLFDGARFGQYLGGYDPRNSAWWLQRWSRWQRGDLRQPHGFVNERCVDDPSRYNYCVIKPTGLAVPAIVSKEHRFPLANLHVHSKNLHRFSSATLDGVLASNERIRP